MMKDDELQKEWFTHSLTPSLPYSSTPSLT